ncbi:hypothetical protein [Flagellimonas okinawensis]|uniref:SMI1/KNR4 family protein n=1 Tax=Flagellimonas okinawensis TaxID=3031324 RepID=A0ABT5XL41_9FLAO|nr:hypothetical protein [[Muricauda] okinawensis]MDF0706608.1 hypothetical protein [[Muricauda] okinawensis]
MNDELKLLEALEIESIEKWPPLFLALNGDTGFFVNSKVGDIAAGYFEYEVVDGKKYFNTDDVENGFDEIIGKIRRGDHG